MNHIDFIGDIHGYADKLVELLEEMGYTNHSGYYQHPTRKVLFVGDYIDRGPQIRETLELVKGMVDNGSADALMGNHEFNAICFQTLRKDGKGYHRKHLIKNVKQHAECLFQFQNKQSEYDEYIEWFKTLPMFYEADSFRAVHATWSYRAIKVLRTYYPSGLLGDLDEAMANPEIVDAIEVALKGKELALPKGRFFLDKDGNKRTNIRIKWWLDKQNQKYTDLSIHPNDNIGDAIFNAVKNEFYLPIEKPVFFGHYWLKGEPNLYRGNICCLDYSVAKKGYLCAYRFDGEAVLSENKFFFV